MLDDKDTIGTDVPVEVKEIKPDPINLYRKMWEVMRDTPFIADDKTNAFHKYKYASEETIKRTLHKQFIDKRILFHFSVQNQSINDVKGLTQIVCHYSFIDIDTGAVITGPFVGQGEDSGDKGVWKAVTGAIKYVLTSNFLIPTGDDPEDENQKEAVRAAVQARNTEEIFNKPASDSLQMAKTSSSNVSNPDREYWKDAQGAFHSWVDTNPDGDPNLGNRR